MSRLLIHVQYLKGIGHLHRIGLIAEACVGLGLDVHIVSGGLPLETFRPEGAMLHQLPPLQAGPGGFADLRNEQGRTVEDDWKGARREALLGLFEKIAPDLLLIETFPFGRRVLDFELMPLLEAALARNRKPAIVCSIRDILQENRKPERTRETLDRVNGYFDTVLVHGDPDFLPLERTFPAITGIRPPLEYTGIVAPAAERYRTGQDTPAGEVIVSVGGGGVGPRLPQAALAARALTPLRHAPWRLITGPHLEPDDFAKLTEAAPEGVTVERFRADFPALLSAAALSISYAGYNTAADILRIGTRAVLISYSGGDGRESEQAVRAARMQDLGRGIALADHAVTPETLAEAVTRTLTLEPASATTVRLDGAERSAELLARRAKGKPS